MVLASTHLCNWCLACKATWRKYELFRFISKELHQNTANLHYQLIWQPCLHASKKKRTHGWCSIFIMLLDNVTLDKACLRNVDSDVVVPAINICIFHQLRLSALWIGYGIGKTCKAIPIHHISQIKCLDLNIVKCCPSSMLSQGAFSIINAWYRQKDCMECLECLS